MKRERTLRGVLAEKNVKSTNPYGRFSSFIAADDLRQPRRKSLLTARRIVRVSRFRICFLPLPSFLFYTLDTRAYTHARAHVPRTPSAQSFDVNY